MVPVAAIMPAFGRHARYRAAALATTGVPTFLRVRLYSVPRAGGAHLVIDSFACRRVSQAGWSPAIKSRIAPALQTQPNAVVQEAVQLQ